MAIKGLSIPVCGNYQNNNGTVTYTEPFIADSAIEYGVSWTVGEDNPLRADNKIKENDKGTFQSGELTLGTAELPQEIALKILGAKENAAVEYGEGGTTTETVYDDDQKSPYLGFGIIEEHQENDVDKYRAVFFPKVYFNLPEEAATTRGETVEWQTKTITGVIQRSDEMNEKYKHPWMIDAWFNAESEAFKYLMYKCGKTGGA